MAYTTDRTWVTGEVVTAAYFNTYLRDNVKWLSTDKGFAWAYHNTTQSIANASFQSVVFNTNLYDNASIHSTSVNTERFTIPAAMGGKWLFGSSVSFAPNATGMRQLGLWTGYVTQGREATTIPTAGENAQLTTCSIQVEAAGNTMQSVVYQNSTAALNLNANVLAWTMWMSW